MDLFLPNTVDRNMGRVNKELVYEKRRQKSNLRGLTLILTLMTPEIERLVPTRVE